MAYLEPIDLDGPEDEEETEGQDEEGPDGQEFENEDTEDGDHTDDAA